MGADLILQDVCIRHRITHDPDKDGKFWNKLQKALDKKVDKMTVDELKGWDDEASCINSDNERELRIGAHKVIQAAIEDMSGGCRDMTWITLPNNDGLITVYLAGGMSWGDIPGETYEDFYRLNMLFADYRFIDEVLDK